MNVSSSSAVARVKPHRQKKAPARSITTYARALASRYQHTIGCRFTVHAVFFRSINKGEGKVEHDDWSREFGHPTMLR